MPRSLLDQEIDKLKKKLLHSGSLVESSVRNAVNSFIERDVQLANKIKEGDDLIDDLEVEIEEDCLKILALHQPVATDLRYIVAALKINNDFERIADLAANIASRALNLINTPLIPAPFDISGMFSQVHKMVKKSLQSLIELNPLIALETLNDDKIIDQLYKETFNEIQRRIKETPDDTPQIILYLSVARHLERIADLATNVAEDVIYLIEGRIVRHKRAGV